jgi:predicted aconitase with swiveling domain
MYRLEISSFAGTIIVQTSEFAFLADVESAVKNVVEKHKNSIGPKVNPFIVAKPAARRGRGRPAGSRNKK